MADRLYRVFTSLRLTVTLLGLGLILVFWGTLAQVQLGLYKAQNDFFRSFFIYWSPGQSSLRIPVFPCGYLIGWLLLINLFAAHFRYYQPGRKKYGIAMIHLGVVLLLFGQLLTDVLSTESVMHLRKGDMMRPCRSRFAWRHSTAIRHSRKPPLRIIHKSRQLPALVPVSGGAACLVRLTWTSATCRPVLSN